MKKNTRVLIVEDEPLVGEMVQGLLEETGHTVVGIATNGQEAVELTEKIQPDVLLMDIELPDMDGIQASHHIQASHPTPVVVLSAYDTPELVEQASEAGIGAYLVKPPHAREIERAISLSIDRFADLMALRRLNVQLQAEIAERERAQAQRDAILKALQESEEKFRRVIQQSQEGIAIVDEQGLLVEWNRAMERYTGLDAKEILDRPIWDVQFILNPKSQRTPQAYESLKTSLSQFLETGQAPWANQLLERSYQHPDGTQRFLQGVVYSIKTSRGFMLATITRDVTHRKQTQQALEKSEQEKQAILSSISDPVTYQDREKKILWANKAAGESVGMAPEQLVGRYCYAVWRQQDQPCVGCPVTRVFKTGQPEEIEITSVDGRVWHVHGYPVQDEAGQVVGAVEVKSDITARIQAEEILRQRNRELESFNRLGQELAATLDQEQVIARLLPVVSDALGAEGACIWLWEEAQTFANAQPSADLPQEGLVCRAFFDQGQNRLLPLDLCLAAGQGVVGWVMQTGRSAIVPHAPDDPRFFPGLDEQTDFHTLSLLAVPLWVRGKVIGVLQAMNKLNASMLAGGHLTSFDGNDRALLETLAASAAVALDNARLITRQRLHAAELEARNEELDAFAHTAAHDLKSPLSRIIGYAELLLEDWATVSDEQAQSHLETVIKNGQKMTNIVDELLLLAGVRQMGNIRLQPLNMRAIAARAEARLTNLIAEQETEVKLAPSLGTTMALGYEPWIEEVWVNYLSNAIKYGGQPPRIELGAGPIAEKEAPSPEPGMVCFWIRDNGPGLTPQEQKHLFTPFTRLDQVRAKGHGLGLSIVRRIVQKLGGEVGVESQTGQGSLFWFTLPAAR